MEALPDALERSIESIAGGPVGLPKSKAKGLGLNTPHPAPHEKIYIRDLVYWRADLISDRARRDV